MDDDYELELERRRAVGDGGELEYARLYYYSVLDQPVDAAANVFELVRACEPHAFVVDDVENGHALVACASYVAARRGLVLVLVRACEQPAPVPARDWQHVVNTLYFVAQLVVDTLLCSYAVHTEHYCENLVLYFLCH